MTATKSDRALKVLAGVFMALMAILLVFFAGVNIFVGVVYQSFYAQAEREFAIPGVSEGFIPQDLDCLEDGTWLFSGYMTKDGESPVYFLRPDGTTGRFLPIRPDGSSYDGHGSGITSDANWVFLTDGEGFLAFELAEVEAAGSNATIQAQTSRPLEFAPAFLNIEEGVLYAGNFYHPQAYETPSHHQMDTPSGDWNPAVMYAYPASETEDVGYESVAAWAYSIPPRIQGMCLTGNGQMVLSQSYGLATSHLLVYDLAATAEDEALEPAEVFFADGREVPLYYLDSLALSADIAAPPMTEGIEWHDGRVFIACESASDKYLFGKIYGGDIVYGLKIG